MDQKAKKTRWLVVALAAVVICGIVAFLFVRNGNGNTPSTPASASTDISSGKPWSGTPFTPASASPTPPTASDLEGYIPNEFDGYTWENSADDPSALEAGATNASSGTFQSNDEALNANLAQWATEEEAAAYAQQLGADENPGSSPLVDGDINSGAGHYWYYPLDDSDQQAVVYWYFGTFTGKLVGDPYSVQEFFLAFPR